MQIPVFEESYSPGKSGLWLTILGLLIVTVYAYFQLMAMGIFPFLLLAFIPAAAFLFYLMLLVGRFRLDIAVQKGALEFQYHPMQKEIQVIEWKYIKGMEKVEIGLLQRMAGWGLLFGTVRYFSVGAMDGVRFTLSNGKGLVLGCKDPDGLMKAIRRVK